MKYLFFLIVIATSAITNLQAQDVQHYQSIDLSPTRHCKAVRQGRVLMIAGGVVAGIGGVGYGMYVLVKPEDINGIGPYIAAAFVAEGVTMAALGGLVFLAGKLYERSNPERFSLVGTKSTIGLAYNFR